MVIVVAADFWRKLRLLFSGYFLYNLTKHSVFYKMLGLVWVQLEMQFDKTW